MHQSSHRPGLMSISITTFSDFSGNLVSIYECFDEGGSHFQRIAAPTSDDMNRLLKKIVHWVTKHLEKRGLIERDERGEEYLPVDFNHRFISQCICDNDSIFQISFEKMLKDYFKMRLKRIPFWRILYVAV